MNLETLKRLLGIDPKSILSKRVDPFGAEWEVVQHEIESFDTLLVSNRAVKLPGLARNVDTILRVVAEFKKLKERNVMPLQYAQANDIVVQQLRPEHIGANFSYERDISLGAGKYVGKVDIIPTTADTVFSVPENQIFVITDIVELSPTAPLTAIKAVVDNVPQLPIEATLATRATDLQIIELPHPIVAYSKLDIDGKVESKTAASTVTTYAYPVGVWIGFGKDAPDLVRLA